MRAGTLRTQLVIKQQGTRVDDGSGGGSVPESTFATVWGKIETLSGQELFEARVFNPRVTHQVTMRYVSGIRPSMTIYAGTRKFDIKEPVDDVDNRHRELRMPVEELVTW